MIRRFAVTKMAGLSVSLLALAALGMFASPALGDCPSYDWLPWESIEQLDGTVYAATTWDPDGPCGSPPLLVLGGTFTHAGSLEVNRIVAWDGSNWLPFGGGMTVGGYWDPVVYALTVHNGELYAGGYFRYAGGLEVLSIARWDGVSWHGCGGGVRDYPSLGGVCALATYAGDLIVAGTFDSVAGGYLSATGVAAWDGTTWHQMAAGLSSARALANYGGRLIAAGWNNYSGSAYIGSLGAWDGIAWSPFSDTDGMVFALATHDGQLVAGGAFTSIEGVSASQIALWNGESWQPLGSGLSGRSSDVRALCSYNGSIVAGGRFSFAGGAAARGIARWTGSTWQVMGSGVAGDALALTVLGGDLIVGGRFSTAGGMASYGVARWGCAMMKGDMDCDGGVDLDDVGPFVLALVDAPAYGIQQPDCDVMLADCNRDGYVNGCDIQSFVDLLLDQ